LGLLAFEYGVDDEEIAGETKLSKARALVEHVWRRGDLQGLIFLAQDQRPNVTDWPVIPER
jgi:hypothetical protein